MSTTDLENLALKPNFPLEIEHIIIQIATKRIKYPLKPGATYLNIQLTAKRFRDWVMCRIFRVLDTDSLMRYVEAAGPRFVDEVVPLYGKATTHLMCRVPMHKHTMAIQALHRLLECSPNVQDLVYWPFYENDYPTIKASPHLRRLSITFSGRMPVDIFSPIYINITHLDLMNVVPLDMLARFENLLHLCFVGDGGSWTDIVTQLTQSNRPHCRYLEYITAAYEAGNYAPIYTNDRLVDIILDDPSEDWFRGVNGGIDFWEFSKRIINARNWGYLVNPTGRQYRMWRFNVNIDLTDNGKEWWAQLSRDMN